MPTMALTIEQNTTVLNTTDLNISLDSGHSFDGFQCLAPLELFNLVMNIFSLLINIFHLSIISSLKSLKGMRYRCVLINISLADITNVISIGIFYSCYSFFIFNMVKGEPIVGIPIDIGVKFSNYISFHVFVVASMQKYLAICRPHKYQSYFIIKRMPAVFALTWLYLLLMTTSFSLMSSLTLFSWVETTEFEMFQLSLISILPNLISIILLTQVYREMKKPTNQSLDEATDRRERRGATYLMIIFTLEMIVFALNLVCIVIFYFTGMDVFCKIWNGFIKAPYTISNTVIYGWRSKSYRRTVNKIFGCATAQFGSTDLTA